MLKGHLTILIAVDWNTLKLTLVMTLFGGRMSSVEELSRLHFTLTVEELLHVTCNQTAVSPIHESQDAKNILWVNFFERSQTNSP
jgi:hypothetical protein